ncbi:M23 family peptidase, partial [Pseudoflavonifractor capillosus]|uniref:M23 family peptidase n=1 Tax=Pseudoflavonifractor capillosus TaxID=106588 RepID=UPI00195D2C97
MSSAAVLARTVLLSLTDESSRRKIGWVLAAIFSPVILIVALLCCLLGGTSEHNSSMVELCFHGGALPESVPAEYRIYMEDMQSSFSKLDELTEEINCMTEGDERLDDTRVKAIFYALYFGADDPQSAADQDFVDCFVTYEEHTRTVTVIDENGNEVEQEETYTVAVPITDLETIWNNISAETGLTISAEQKRNADSIYNLVLYGSSTGMEGWIPGADVPYIGADGFCSPIGSGWQSRVTSEFGYRSDPFTGETRGHTGMDLSV